MYPFVSGKLPGATDNWEYLITENNYISFLITVYISIEMIKQYNSLN